MGKLFGILSVLAVFAYDAYAEDSKIDIEAVINNQAEIFLKDERITSLSIGVVSNKDIVTGHYGELIRGQGNQPTDQTIYEIASVSKVILGLLTAHAALRKVSFL